ncbi:MAG: hypothetical protein JRE23_10865 [Deltaproteobacteria bacterium]|nr:hypothetical protein [Deltaproteobacteria bacterium]
MPRGDGTGPRGQGPGTGRGMGGGGQGRGGGQGGGFRGGPGGNCICPKCGHKIPHKMGRPCPQEQCPQCGTAMVRE